MRKSLAALFLSLACGGAALAEGVPEISLSVLRSALAEKLKGHGIADIKNLEVFEDKKEKGAFHICGEVKTDSSEGYTPFFAFIVSMEKYAIMDLSADSPKLCAISRNGGL